MTTFAHFLAMGGYAEYVWPAYGIAAMVLGGHLLMAIKKYRAVQYRLRKQFSRPKP